MKMVKCPICQETVMYMSDTYDIACSNCTYRMKNGLYQYNFVEYTEQEWERYLKLKPLW